MNDERMSLLTVVRCGDNSLHQTWTSDSQGKFDVAVSYFGNEVNKEFPEAKFVHLYKGGKWDGIFDFFQRFPEALNQYQYFWFPDDDIKASSEEVIRCLEIGMANNLQIFQPSLDDNSFYSHLITLQHRSFTLRYTNFVEIMVPFISRELLARTIGLLNGNRSGFGLDYVWPEIAAEIGQDPTKSAAVIDLVSVRHTRPVGGSLHKFMAQVAGASAMDEMNAALKGIRGKKSATINGVKVPRAKVVSGLDQHGEPMVGMRLGLQMTLDLIGGSGNVVQPINKISTLKHALKGMAIAG
jgi:hypothetical protein